MRKGQLCGGNNKKKKDRKRRKSRRTTNEEGGRGGGAGAHRWSWKEAIWTLVGGESRLLKGVGGGILCFAYAFAIIASFVGVRPQAR